MTKSRQDKSGGTVERIDALFADVSASSVLDMLRAAADLVLVVDSAGVVRYVSSTQPEIVELGLQQWSGKRWIDTVTLESRPKIEYLLQGNAQGPKWRHVNHVLGNGAELPLSYAITPLSGPGRQGWLVAHARDLRPHAALQQRLVTAQLSMEREYWRLRSVETRYRLLFQIASEAVLILDAQSGRLEEANPSAYRLLGDDLRRSSWALTDSLAASHVQPVMQLLERVRTSGRSEGFAVRLLDGTDELRLTASLFRQQNQPHFLVRITSTHDASQTHAEQIRQMVARTLEHAPDAFVVTDLDGRVLTANQSFLDLGQLGSEELARGQSIDRWLGRTGVDLSVMLSNLRQHGVMRLFATTLRGEYGSTADVEISACTVQSPDMQCLGFAIRDVGRRLGEGALTDRESPRSASQMTELVGRAPLRDIVRDTTDLIERMCIEAALELTGDNRASAAELLGLSRQSLYIKLRRFGIGEAGGEPLSDAVDDPVASKGAAAS